MVLKLSHFAAQRINWHRKPATFGRSPASSISELTVWCSWTITRLSVREFGPSYPEPGPSITVLSGGYRRALLELAGVFDTLALTAEDRERNRLYVEQRARQNAQAEIKAGGLIEDYLADLQIVVEIEPDTRLSLPRIAQLTGKTNQFNLTTRRYTEAEIIELKTRGWRVFGARVRDRFGDNGLTGVIIAGPTESDTWSIDTLLLSCRVMGRGVETALLARAVEEARQAGARRIDGWYLPTAKNEVVRGCYLEHGFELVSEDARGHVQWRLELDQATIHVPAWLAVQEPSVTRTDYSFLITRAGLPSSPGSALGCRSTPALPAPITRAAADLDSRGMMMARLPTHTSSSMITGFGSGRLLRSSRSWKSLTPG